MREAEQIEAQEDERSGRKSNKHIELISTNQACFANKNQNSGEIEPIFTKYESEYKRIKNSSTHCKQEQVKQISRWQGSATAQKTLATQRPSQLAVVHCAACVTSRM